MRANTFELERTRRPTRSPKVALLWCAPFRTRAAVVGCAPTNQRATPLPSSLLLLLLLLPPALREGTTESLASYNLMLAFLHAAPSHRHMSAPGSMRKKTGKAKSKKKKRTRRDRARRRFRRIFTESLDNKFGFFFLPSLSSLHAP